MRHSNVLATRKGTTTGSFDQRIAKHKFIKQLHKRFQEEKIKIPFPIREVYTQGNQTKNGNGVLTPD